MLGLSLVSPLSPPPRVDPCNLMDKVKLAEELGSMQISLLMYANSPLGIIPRNKHKLGNLSPELSSSVQTSPHQMVGFRTLLCFLSFFLSFFICFFLCLFLSFFHSFFLSIFLSSVLSPIIPYLSILSSFFFILLFLLFCLLVQCSILG
jgi:hypothetical protein